MTDLRYPIGKFTYNGPLTEDQKQKFLDEIAQAPANLRTAVKGLSAEQLDTPYRPDGWTVRQVAHHVPDSHLNAYLRFKLALTEEEPTIKPYAEDRWAKLYDTQATPVEVSLTMPSRRTRSYRWRSRPCAPEMAARSRAPTPAARSKTGKFG